MSRKHILFWLGATLIFASCAHNKIDLGENYRVEKKGVLAISGRWLKDKDEKFDMLVSLENLADKPVLIPMRSFQCLRGNKRGRMENSFIEGGQEEISLASGQAIDLIITCRHYAVVPGPFRLLIKKVVDNPNGDGVTQGKVLAENLEWSLAYKKK